MNFIFEPWHWFVLGVALMLLELILPMFAALWFGLAALIVGIIVLLFPQMSFAVQIWIWIILSIGCTVLWFKLIKPLSVDKTKAGLPREATIGQVGIVIQIGLMHDQVRVRFTLPVLGADEWNCRSLQSVQVGDRVVVTDISGNDLVIKPYQTSSVL
ncbi:NfeD family protein [Acinetobacter rudis]|uniref:NfeD family protein n=1 Tax=Acinetobacter rudis TaxID=632955 RepID=A0AAW8JDQ1_9GAMM|nr:NfeD family protein [Acinetobacter rudis]MDQ8936786.1 NfeD family protein [Acinetobacter rudis]MDQ8953221.1 NfeD family protein [Acinetobacter rudis]MDQ9019032.1 NfeD family protein [Acinetobacter rudis]